MSFFSLVSFYNTCSTTASGLVNLTCHFQHFHLNHSTKDHYGSLYFWSISCQVQGLSMMCMIHALQLIIKIDIWLIAFTRRPLPPSTIIYGFSQLFSAYNKQCWDNLLVNVCTHVDGNHCGNHPLNCWPFSLFLATKSI